MLLPCDATGLANPTRTVGPVGSFCELELGLYQREEWCPHCLKVQPFIELLEYEAGRLAVCVGCEQERTFAFSRTTEAA